MGDQAQVHVSDDLEVGVSHNDDSSNDRESIMREREEMATVQEGDDQNQIYEGSINEGGQESSPRVLGDAEQDNGVKEVVSVGAVREMV